MIDNHIWIIFILLWGPSVYIFMQSIAAGLTSDHLKLLFCLVLAALSFLKVSDIQDKKTRIKKQYQIKVNTHPTHGKCIQGHSQLHPSITTAGTRSCSQSCAQCRDSIAHQKIPHHPQCTSTATSQHPTQQQTNTFCEGNQLASQQLATLGSYIFSKYRRQMKEANRNPLVNDSYEIGGKLRRQFQQCPNDGEQINQFRMGEKEEIVMEEKMDEQHYQTPKISRQYDSTKMGTEKTQLSFKQEQNGTAQYTNGNFAWPNVGFAPVYQKAVVAEEEESETQQKHKKIRKNHTQKTRKPKIDFMRNHEPSLHKLSINNRLRLNRIGKDREEKGKSRVR